MLVFEVSPPANADIAVESLGESGGDVCVGVIRVASRVFPDLALDATTDRDALDDWIIKQFLEGHRLSPAGNTSAGGIVE